MIVAVASIPMSMVCLNLFLSALRLTSLGVAVRLSETPKEDGGNQDGR